MNLHKIRTHLQDKRVGARIRLNTSTNHGVIVVKSIKDTSNGIGTDNGVPQESTTGIRNTVLEETMGGGGELKGGISENERGT